MTTELKQRAEALRKELDALDKAIAKSEEYDCLSAKVSRLSPTFDTKKNAEDAIEKVGAERILWAFKALKGMS